MAVDTRERFKRWYESLPDRTVAARLACCDRSYLPQLASGPKTPGRKIASAIERATAEWDEGPILAIEWDEVEARERPEPANDAPEQQASEPHAAE